MPSVAIIGTRGYPSFYGGFETAVRNLAPYLSVRGWDVTVYSRETRAHSTADVPRINVVRTPGIQTKSLSTLTYGFTSTLHAAASRPDVALIMNVANGFWLPLLKARSIPTIVNVDGVEWLREKWGRFAKATFFAGARATARLADGLVMDARAIDDFWRAQFGRGGTWIPYGAAIGPVPNDALPRGLTPGRYVLAVARLVPENSIPEFLDAAERLAEGVDVVLVGSSGYGGELEQRASSLEARLERFHKLGHIRDDRTLFSLWKNCGVYFHGHSVGGTNPALVQAMALGAPTVARDTIFNREVLGDSGLFTDASTDSIVRRIRELLENPRERQRLGAAAAQRAASVYSWESVNAEYERVLVEAIAKRASKAGRG